MTRLIAILLFTLGTAQAELPPYRANTNSPATETGVSPDGSTLLHRAVEAGEINRVKALIAQGARVGSTNRYGISPLWIACRDGHEAIVQSLLAAKADPNTLRPGGETVLMTASRTGHPGVVRALLEAGAKIDAKDRRGQTAVMWAAAEGHVQVIESLISAGADFRSPLDSGFTPLLFAVREGRAEVVHRLIKAGADINESIEAKRRASRGPQTGMTPLLMAVENGHFELALDLVKAGANPNDQRAGYTALHNITWVRKPDHGEGEDGMPPPAGSGKVSSLDFVRQLVKAGADINARVEKPNTGLGVLNRKGATPFLLAAKTADLALLKLLRDLGTDPSINTTEGVTPLIAAAGLGTLAAGEVAGTEDEVLETLRWLVSIGQDVNAVDANGETAMHAAAYKNLPKAVEFLSSHGARIEVWNQKDRHGWTPLLIAEGFRPGNFKPSFETIAAIHQAMKIAGVTPPPPTKADGINNSDFGPRDRKYTQP
ncbi:MAG: hypothetical protein FJ405_13595 [Verrucomicrobia bacterium]|nr:hypothetical protein [Verrucomicrobiota bacterium]